MFIFNELFDAVGRLEVSRVMTLEICWGILSDLILLPREDN